MNILDVHLEYLDRDEKIAWCFHLRSSFGVWVLWSHSKISLALRVWT